MSRCPHSSPIAARASPLLRRRTRRWGFAIAQRTPPRRASWRRDKLTPTTDTSSAWQVTSRDKTQASICSPRAGAAPGPLFEHRRILWCLARDAAGAERFLAWGRLEERVLFASEPKAIARTPGFERRLRHGALAQFLSFSFVPERESMIQNIFRLGPGESATFRGSRPVYQRWFKAEECEGQTTRSDADWVMEFAETLRSAVRQRLVHTTPAATLSGGIDSSVIASLLARQLPKPLPTYTAHFGLDTPNELAEARAVADHVGTQHEEVHVDPADFLPNMEAAVWHLDDPIGDPVTIGNYALARAIKGGQHIFNGEGGDPLFGGPKNLTMALHHVYGGVDHTEGFRERAYLRSYRRAYTESLPAHRRRAETDQPQARP